MKKAYRTLRLLTAVLLSLLMAASVVAYVPAAEYNYAYPGAAGKKGL